MKGRIRDMVRNIGDVLHTQVPKLGRGVGSVHCLINNPFESLIAAFKRRLVLIVGFAEPKLNP